VLCCFTELTPEELEREREEKKKILIRKVGGLELLLLFKFNAFSQCQ